MKKILVLLLVCALVFSLMSMTACRQQTNNNSNNNNQSNNNQDNNNQDDNNQGDNNQGDNNPDNTTVEPDDEPVKDGTIETPPIPVGSTNNGGK